MITTNATSVLNTIEWRVESWSRSDWGMVGSSGCDDAFCALWHSLAMVRCTPMLSVMPGATTGCLMAS